MTRIHLAGWATLAMTMIAATTATAQFIRPGGFPNARTPPAKPSGTAQPSRRDVQTSWTVDETRKAMTTFDFLPRQSVAPSAQRALTEYAPAGPVQQGYGRDWTPDDCERSIRKAEIRYGLPPYLLHAIALTESGRGGRPTPTAMNIQGRAYFATGTRDMEAVVARFGVRSSIDVGCMQVNLKYHAGRFRDWRSLLIPEYNAEYAALYLTELRKRYGTWNGAVGAYHNKTPWRAANYACLVSRKWSQMFGSSRPGCGASIEAMARYMYRSYAAR